MKPRAMPVVLVVCGVTPPPGPVEPHPVALRAARIARQREHTQRGKGR